jgi:hypothetical protein
MEGMDERTGESMVEETCTRVSSLNRPSTIWTEITKPLDGAIDAGKFSSQFPKKFGGTSKR